MRNRTLITQIWRIVADLIRVNQQNLRHLRAIKLKI
jgi:hypothetical protein